ncbi:hypothetical protein [Streptomyces palmae]|nr:hypothetical protein [Streptomyces palmae]
MTAGARPEVRVVEAGEEESPRLLGGVPSGRVVFTHQVLPAP